MAEWKRMHEGLWVLKAGDTEIRVESWFGYDGWATTSPYDFSQYVRLSTDAEAAKREAVALFRAKLEAALKEIEGL